MFKLFAAFVLFVHIQNSFQLNNRPILGVLLQEEHDKIHQKVASSYVKWLESAGARVVPIFLNKPNVYYTHLLSQINGVLLTGGGNPLTHTHYSNAADLILSWALRANAHDNYFPVWGTCLSFQKFATYFTASSLDWATRCDMDDIALPLDIPANVTEKSSKVFASDGTTGIINILRQNNVTANYHISCLSTEYWYWNRNLTSQFTVLSTNTFHNITSVSMIEHRKYPLYASVWHPEKNQFEWVVGRGVGHISHDQEAIQVGQYFANFLVGEARKNGQKFANATEEAETLMYNFNHLKVYEGKEPDAYFTEIYRFKQ